MAEQQQQPSNPPTDDKTEIAGAPKDAEQREPLLIARQDATGDDQKAKRTVPVANRSSKAERAEAYRDISVYWS
uniref:Uncharacterized protein n=1 Tax=Meloidogyne floridensis TaxID=298350 RepID=A0A915NP99_9BILA